MQVLSAKWHNIFSHWDRSLVFDKKYQKTSCLACAHVYVGCDTVRMNTPQKVIVVESQSAIHTIPKNAPFIFLRAPGKGNNVQVSTIYNTQKISHLCGIKYGYLGPCQSAFTPARELLIDFYNHCGNGEGHPVCLLIGFVTSRPGDIYAVIRARLFHELKRFVRFKFSSTTN